MDLLCTIFVIVNWREHGQITNVNGYNIMLDRCDVKGILTELSFLHKTNYDNQILICKTE